MGTCNCIGPPGNCPCKGGSWTPPTQPTWAIPAGTFTFPNMLQHPWICPKCQGVNGPLAMKCGWCKPCDVTGTENVATI